MSDQDRDRNGGGGGVASDATVRVSLRNNMIPRMVLMLLVTALHGSLVRAGDLDFLLTGDDNGFLYTNRGDGRFDLGQADGFD